MHDPAALKPGPPRVALRFDAGPQLGGGHAVRCLALAKALASRGADVLLLVNAEAPAAVPALQAAPYPCLKVSPGAAAAVHAIRGHWPDGADLAVVDHYAWDETGERELRATAARVAVLDDLADRRHDCDLLIDQNAGRRAKDYKALLPHTALRLIGPRYAILRPEFAAARANRGAPIAGAPAAPRVLVSMGLTDLEAITARVTQALLRHMPEARCDVVVAVNSPSAPELRRLAEENTRLHVHGPRDGPAMAAMMAEADLAFGGGGTTSWERCCLGLPSVILILAENQRAGAAALEAAGAAIVFERDPQGLEAAAAAAATLAADKEACARMSAAAFALVDGEGAQRCAAAILGLTEKISLHPAEAGDARLLFNWRNDPQTRAMSRTQDELDWLTHQAWVSRILADRQHMLLMARIKDQPAGMVRFDPRPEKGAGHVEVSIALAPEMRGRALAAPLLAAACERFRKAHRPAEIWATIRDDNAASQQAFAACGFEIQSCADGFTFRVWRP